MRDTSFLQFLWPFKRATEDDNNGNHQNLGYVSFFENCSIVVGLWYQGNEIWNGCVKLLTANRSMVSCGSRLEQKCAERAGL